MLTAIQVDSLRHRVREVEILAYTGGTTAKVSAVRGPKKGEPYMMFMRLLKDFQYDEER
jgi:hypothetical protein